MMINKKFLGISSFLMAVGLMLLLEAKDNHVAVAFVVQQKQLQWKWKQQQFLPSLSTTKSTTVAKTSLGAATRSKSDDAGADKQQKDNNNVNNMFAMNKMLSMALLTASCWMGPVAMDSAQHTGLLPTTNRMQQQKQLTTRRYTTTAVMAKEMASASGSRVNKDAESLLRYGLPINSKEVRKVQGILEEVKLDIGSKRKSAALDKVKQTKKLVASTKDMDKIKNACRERAKCDEYLDTITKSLDPLSDALKESMDAFLGSEQERKALDDAYNLQRKAIDTVGLLEEQMVPPGYYMKIPEIYDDLPQLRGRATVQMTLTKSKSSDVPGFDVNGQIYPKAVLTMVLDGYSVPVTAGNFVELVQKGFYDNMAIQRSDGFVIQTGNPAGPAEGYVGDGSKSVGNGKNGERLIPLEILVKGDKQPIYETTIEDDGRGGEATVLPFNAYGAMGWAREEYDPNSGSSQFFWLLFDSDLTPAGKNVLDGRYPCFGYVVEGADFLGDIGEGDLIVSAKVIQGAENLKLPETKKEATTTQVAE